MPQLPTWGAPGERGSAEGLSPLPGVTGGVPLRFLTNFPGRAGGKDKRPLARLPETRPAHQRAAANINRPKARPADSANHGKSEKNKGTTAQSNAGASLPPIWTHGPVGAPGPPSRGSPPASPATRTARSTARRGAAARRSRGSSPPTRRPHPDASSSCGCRRLCGRSTG